MKRQGVLGAVLIAVMVFAVARWSPAQPVSTSSGSQGFFGEAMDTLVAEPDYHFSQARAHLQKGETDQALVELAKGVAFLKLEAGRSTAPAQEELTDAVFDLEKAARSIKRKTVAAGELDRTCGRALEALARHRFLLARDAWSGKDWQKTGGHLQAAVLHLQQLRTWGGEEWSAERTKIVEEAGVVAKALIEGPGCGTDWVPKATDSALGQLGEELGISGQEGTAKQ